MPTPAAEGSLPHAWAFAPVPAEDPGAGVVAGAATPPTGKAQPAAEAAEDREEPVATPYPDAMPEAAARGPTDLAAAAATVPPQTGVAAAPAGGTGSPSRPTEAAPAGQFAAVPAQAALAANPARDAKPQRHDAPPSGTVRPVRPGEVPATDASAPPPAASPPTSHEATGAISESSLASLRSGGELIGGVPPPPVAPGLPDAGGAATAQPGTSEGEGRRPVARTASPGLREIRHTAPAPPAGAAETMGAGPVAAAGSSDQADLTPTTSPPSTGAGPETRPAEAGAATPSVPNRRGPTGPGRDAVGDGFGPVAPAVPAQAGPPLAEAPAPVPRAAPRHAPVAQVTPVAVALALDPSAGGRIALRLDPGELGRVEIVVERSREAATVHVAAERPETLALLARDGAQLDRALRDAGIGGMAGAACPSRCSRATADRAARPAIPAAAAGLGASRPRSAPRHRGPAPSRPFSTSRSDGDSPLATTTATSSTGTAAAAASAATGARSRLGDTMDNFLTLLTTQLKNQSPTDPLDTNQMTAQLVQFASVEQQIAMNRNMEQLVSLQQTSALTQAAPLIGRQVEVEGDRLPLQDGTATLRLPAAGTARSARVAIVDEGGRTIREAQVTLGSGATTWQWDGKDSRGVRQADGAYRVAVTGSDSSGGPATVNFTVLGTATGAERADNAVRLRLGAAAYGFDKVRSVSPGT
ncbi:flagellar hook capping FlgD N-terminal domain-containing protein [Roseomonas sp. CCTCC AB2023176]|uniref:flagellar hook capping FlgD N-terminal domain-containing protein n=1 Tax=Roseomonas sp. CCTCC AB2023176 TaxID=3342640 RepID=UPI0035D9FC50